MIDNLTALGLGIVIFAIILGVGTIVLQKFAAGIASCGTGVNSETLTYNTSDAVCYNASGSSANPVSAATTVYNMQGELNTTSGLGSWTSAIVALAVGLLFIGALMAGRGRRY